MRLFSIVFLTVSLAGAAEAGAQAQWALPPRAVASEARSISHAGPMTHAFIAREAAREIKLGDVSEATARTAANAVGPSLGATSGGDIDALVLWVLMEVNREADAELRSELASMEAINAQKKGNRDQVNAMKQADARMKGEAAAEFKQLHDNGKIAPSVTLDDYTAARDIAEAGSKPPQTLSPNILSRQTEIGPLRELPPAQQQILKPLIDRRAAAQASLGVILKRVDDTASDIGHNLK